MLIRNKAVRGASNLLFFPVSNKIFSGSIHFLLSLHFLLYYTTGPARTSALASTKITLLSLSCSNQRHNQDNHNNQRSISLLRHYFCVAEQDRIGSASGSSSAEIVGDRAPHCQRGCNWLPPSAPAEQSLHLAANSYLLLPPRLPTFG